MTADLATLGTGTAAPGRFFGRRGPGPDAAIAVAYAVPHALAALEPDPGTPLAGYPVPLTRVDDCAEWLADGLGLEARMAARALTVDLSLPEPDAAREVRLRLKAATRGTRAAMGHLRASGRALSRELGGAEDPGAGCGWQLAHHAHWAAESIWDLKAELARAADRPVPASLPMVDGHRQIADAAALILVHLVRICGQLGDGISGACAELGRQASARSSRITGPLYQAPADLRRAAKDVTRARAVLEDAADQIRKAPPGFPCGGCGGSGVKWAAPCGRCRGGGTDPFAERQ
jgi:hypothetical protein